jgi:hypothetical protein
MELDGTLFYLLDGQRAYEMIVVYLMGLIAIWVAPACLELYTTAWSMDWSENRSNSRSKSLS